MRTRINPGATTYCSEESRYVRKLVVRSSDKWRKDGRSDQRIVVCLSVSFEKGGRKFPRTGSRTRDSYKGRD